MFQAGYPLTKRLLNFVYKVSALSPTFLFSSSVLSKSEQDLDSSIPRT